MRTPSRRLPILVGAAAMLLLAACGGGGGARQDSGSGDGERKIFIALSYSGNAWQSEAQNLALAIGEAAPDTDVSVQIAGTDPQAQISQYQSMIAQGADAIVSFPVSPTALNRTIKDGCERGVKFFMYDATVTEPCAWNVSYITGAPKGQPDKPFFGANTAQALIDLLDGKGKILMSRGVPGNSVDETHYKTARAVFDKYPDIEIVGEYYGMWDSSTTQKETQKALASNAQVDGIWAEAGEDGVIKALEAANRPKIPVVGENANYFRQSLLEGWPGVSAGSPPASAGIAMKLALQVLDQGDESVPKDVELNLPWVESDAVKECEGAEFVDGCNLFAPDLVPASFVTEIFDADLLPEASLTAAEDGKLASGVTLEPLPDDLGPWTQPPSRRLITRGTCDSGWKEGPLPSGVTGCVEG